MAAAGCVGLRVDAQANKTQLAALMAAVRKNRPRKLEWDAMAMWEDGVLRGGMEKKGAGKMASPAHQTDCVRPRFRQPPSLRKSIPQQRI